MFGESALIKAKTVLSAGKVIATVFWDSQGIILIDLQKDKTITGEYYTTLLDRLKEELKKNGQDWRAKKCSFIKTTRRPTSRHLQWQNYTNWAMN